jgi:tetratricopeptide (TPR) repeat protein
MKSPRETKNEQYTGQQSGIIHFERPASFYTHSYVKAGAAMFAHLFATMNDKLDEIRRLYPRATGSRRDQLDRQLDTLKEMSDTIVEQWLLFEEKLADFLDQSKTSAAPSIKATAPSKAASEPERSAAHKEAAAAAATTHTAGPSPSSKDGQEEWSLSTEVAIQISKGQGYFKLHMFSHAATELEQAIVMAPDCQLARMFLAMTHMHLQQWNDAQRHFQILISLTNYAKWRAIGYNALGCIQAVGMNLELAEHYFLKAHDADPSFADSLMNLKCCKERNGQLSLRFGSTELIR